MGIGVVRCGKTWIVRSFCREYDQDYIYLSMGDLDEKQLAESISARAVFLVLDDINDRESYIRARRIILKIRGDESLPDYRIIMVGTEIGSAYYRSKQRSGEMDVDEPYMYRTDEDEYIYHITVYPMNLLEFHSAIQDRWQTAGRGTLSYRDILNIYLIVGGMPQCVSLFLQSGDFTDVRTLQRRMVEDICGRLSGRTLSSSRERRIVDSISVQGISDSVKFSLRAVKCTARYREYGDCLDRMCTVGLAHRVYRLDSQKGEVAGDYQMYLADVGLAGAMAGIDERDIMGEQPIWQIHHRYLLRTFVVQEYYGGHYHRQWQLRCWHRRRAKARVPFVFVSRHKGDMVVADMDRMWRRSIDSFIVQYPDTYRRNMTIDDVTSVALGHNI